MQSPYKQANCPAEIILADGEVLAWFSDGDKFMQGRAVNGDRETVRNCWRGVADA